LELRPLHLHQLRKFREVAVARPARLAAEARHALRNVGLEPDARLLAVVADVDAGRGLLRDHILDRLVDFRGKLRLVDRLARLAADQQVA
jgi:hypothetical protein